MSANTFATICTVIVFAISCLGGYLLTRFVPIEYLVEGAVWATAACFLFFLAYTVKLLILVTIRHR